MSSSSNSGEGFKILIFLGVMVFLVMYLFDLGPFKESYTPTPTYYNNYGGGSQPSFGGSQPSSWKANAYYEDGSFAYKVTVYDDYIVIPSLGDSKYNYYSTTGTGDTRYAYFVDMGTFFIYF